MANGCAFVNEHLTEKNHLTTHMTVSKTPLTPEADNAKFKSYHLGTSVHSNCLSTATTPVEDILPLQKRTSRATERSSWTCKEALSLLLVYHDKGHIVNSVWQKISDMLMYLCLCLHCVDSVYKQDRPQQVCWEAGSPLYVCKKTENLLICMSLGDKPEQRFFVLTYEEDYVGPLLTSMQFLQRREQQNLWMCLGVNVHCVCHERETTLSHMQKLKTVQETQALYHAEFHIQPYRVRVNTHTHTYLYKNMYTCGLTAYVFSKQIIKGWLWYSNDNWNQNKNQMWYIFFLSTFYKRKDDSTSLSPST